MEKKFRKIAVLTSGGDAPGMNAAIRAVVNCAYASGVEVWGLKKGYTGLLDDEMVALTPRDVANIARDGGTFLYSDRCDRFKTAEGMADALANCEKNQIDGVIAIGGDGTFRGATDLSNNGIPTIGIPGTIDNDITSTDYSIGFDTAMNTVVDIVNRLQDTCESHARCEIIEVMGRNAGDIALYTGMAVGAVGIAIPEVPFDEAACLENIKDMRENGQRQFTIIVAEGLEGYAEALEKKIKDDEEMQKLRVEPKFCRLAHIVRGGSPTLRDRVMGARFGEAAVAELFKGNSNLVVVEQKGEIKAVNINYALILDRMYKNKLKDGDLDKFTAEQVAEMKAFCEAKRAELVDTYRVANAVTK